MTVAAVEKDIQKARQDAVLAPPTGKTGCDTACPALALTTEDKMPRACSPPAKFTPSAFCRLLYKFFMRDGYGKESLILNMNGEVYEQADNARKYFTACLLVSTTSSLHGWSTHREKLADFNTSKKPLWVFVGNTVSGEESDILDVVNFRRLQTTKLRLADLLADRAQILDQGNNFQRTPRPDAVQRLRRTLRGYSSSRVQCPARQR